jgi:hypothetical protein
MKHLPTFESFNKNIDESFRIGTEGEKSLAKMKVKGDRGEWELNAVELDDDGKSYIIITGEYARTVTSGDTIWIPKDQWNDFKQLINKI